MLSQQLSQQKKSSIRFNLFQTKHDIQECMDFQLNHVAKLKKYSIKVSSTGLNWMYSENVYGITAIDENGKLIGGIRIHVKSKEHKLPFEDALKCEVKCHNGLPKLQSAEICALWTSKKLDHINLPESLVNCAATLCKELGIGKIYSFPWQRTKDLVAKIGFNIDPKLGKNDGIPYPTEQYRSYLMSIKLENLKLAKTKETEQFSNQLKMGRFGLKSTKPVKIIPRGIPTLGEKEKVNQRV